MKKGYLVQNNHEMPVADDIEHHPQDWCTCNPIPLLVDGIILWQHPALDCREIVNDAEAIRLWTSVLLWRESQETGLTHDQVHFHPFEDQEVVWPPTSIRVA